MNYVASVILTLTIISCTTTCPPCLVNQRIIDSLKVNALREVDEYKAKAEYQVDTMRYNMLKERNIIVSEVNALLEALNENNMLIDTINCGSEVTFENSIPIIRTK